MECELCKTAFPNKVVRPGVSNAPLRMIKYDLPEFEAAEEPAYIVLESVSSSTSKVIHVVNMAKSE